MNRVFASSLAVLAALAIPASAEIIDRVAVSIGNGVITTSDIDREIRVTALQNRAQPDFSAAARRTTAERLVEQKLIRRELELSHYPVPDSSAALPMLEEFKSNYFQTEQEYRDALDRYGITEQDLKDALLWQLTLVQFIDVRFRPAVAVTDQQIQDYFEKVVKPAAQAAHPSSPPLLEDYRDEIEDTLSGQQADREMDMWLKQAESRSQIVFHEEAFQ